mgnify:CR=1 FL=1
MFLEVVGGFPNVLLMLLFYPLLGSLAGVGRCVQFNFHASDYTDLAEKRKHKNEKSEKSFLRIFLLFGAGRAARRMPKMSRQKC